MTNNGIILLIFLILLIICIYLFIYKKESFEDFSSSCYEANDENNCYTCEDVITAYKKKGYIYDKNEFEQCKT
jgi:hypothetical protein